MRDFPLLPARLVDNRLEVGVDEVGRGCLAGPVVAAAVALPVGFSHPYLFDSKALSLGEKHEAERAIKAAAIAWAIAVIPPATIDEINILNASILGMHQAIEQLALVPEMILVDGNRFKPYPFVPHQCIVKGDSKVGSIAAASILAKLFRDRLMSELSSEFPQYGWQDNVGYPTPHHLKALAEHGVTEYHRRSYRPVRERLSLGS